MPRQTDNEIISKMREELRKCRGKWMHLSRLTGRQLSYRWIVAFASGEIPSPSFQKICLLGKYIGIKITTAPCGHFLKYKPE